jgi:hypothetical protein
MNEDKKSQSTDMDRRQLVRKGIKVAYTVPLVLAAVKASERPAYAQGTGQPGVPSPN